MNVGYTHTPVKFINHMTIIQKIPFLRRLFLLGITMVFAKYWWCVYTFCLWQYFVLFSV